VSIGGQRATAGAALASEHEPARSLYVHVPFCFHKCHYCDFYSVVDAGSRDGGARHAAFTRTLVRELERLGPHAGPLRTVFVGGGTPTLLAPGLWRELLAAMRETFDLSGVEEFTVECNPETATAELFDVLVGGGVNRLSFGAQSFNEFHLKTLERWHDPASVGRALALAASAGIGRRSIDLIYGIPGQTLAEWALDLETALALDPGVEHVSCYALTYEPNTAMTARLSRGEFEAADEGLEVEMFELTGEALGRAGLGRYEVSNYARAGRESLHNLAYWRGESWLAAGPSASGHLRTASGGWRWKNAPRLGDWSAGVEARGLPPVDDLEPPEPARALAERVMMGLRLAEGLDAETVEREAAALGAGASFGGAVERQRRDGLLVRRGGRLVLSERGWLYADGVASELMGSLLDR